MSKFFSLVILLLVSFVPLDVIASGFSYTNVNAAYHYVELDDFNMTGDGYELGFSADASEHFAITGSYADYHFENHDFLIGGNQYLTRLGLLFHTSLSENADFTANGDYYIVETDIDSLNYSDKAYGWLAGIGLRYKPPVAASELALVYTRMDIDDRTETLAGIELRFGNRRSAVKVGILDTSYTFGWYLGVVLGVD